MEEVDEVLDRAFETWDVWRLYADPPYIESWLATWAGRWGEKRVIAGRPLDRRQWPGHPSLEGRHGRGELEHCAESDQWCELFSEPRRERRPHDDELPRRRGPALDGREGARRQPAQDRLGPAAVLSWEARLDAIAAGALNTVAEVSAYANYHSLTGEDEGLDGADDAELHGPFVDELVDLEEGITV
jgi:hypothetical protein